MLVRTVHKLLLRHLGPVNVLTMEITATAMRTSRIVLEFADVLLTTISSIASRTVRDAAPIRMHASRAQIVANFQALMSVS